MKRYILLITGILLLHFTTVHAQFTLRIAGGYAGPGLQNTENVLAPAINPATPTVDGLANMANINDSTHTYKPVHGSYGTGGNATIGLGYMFNKYIGIDVGIGFAYSNDISCTEVVPLPYPFSNGYLTANINSYSYALAIAPTVVISGQKTGWKVYPYGRFGITLPVAGELVDNVSIQSPVDLNTNGTGWIGNQTSIQLVTHATVSVGINGTVGVAYRALPYMSVSLEVGGQYLVVRAKSSTVTKWTATINNAGTTQVVNDVPLRGTYRDQFNYVDQLTSSSNNAQYNSSYNPNQPKQDIRPTVPGSDLGFNVGLTFYLSKKTLAKKKPDSGVTTTPATGK